MQRQKSKPIFIAETYSNGDTPKQLLARSRHLLYKSSDRWTENQQLRADILFRLYPAIARAYHLANGLRHIYNLKIKRGGYYDQTGLLV